MSTKSENVSQSGLTVSNFTLMPTDRLTSVCLLHLKITSPRSRSPKWLIDFLRYRTAKKVFLRRRGQKGIEPSRTTATVMLACTGLAHMPRIVKVESGRCCKWPGRTLQVLKVAKRPRHRKSARRLHTRECIEQYNYCINPLTMGIN